MSVAGRGDCHGKIRVRPKKQYEKGAFTNDGKQYDYCFNVSVTATLDNDADNIADWGYVYQDLWGNPPAEIS